MYERDGDGYVGTILTQGGWDPGAAHGGAALALIGQCLDEVPTLVPMTVSRFTADIHRPVPLGRRLHVRWDVIREGKKIQIVELRLLVGEVEHVRVTALRIRDEAIAEGVLASTTDARPADGLIRPEEAMDLREIAPHAPGFLQAVDMRRAQTVDGRSMGSWIRITAPVVAGSPTSPTARMAGMFDFANLVGLADHPTTATMINPDVNAHVLRSPTSEWIALTGDTRFNTAQGRGVSNATFSDADGVFAFATVSQILQTRPPIR
ncbi:MAG: hypothetical protein JWM34_2001 [Ilumatobacteraceae bacterium]|nr:hypothetical protein [Ilumatobacteraceae bacterium]